MNVLLSVLMLLALSQASADGVKELRVAGASEPFWVAASPLSAGDRLSLEAVDSGTRAAIESALGATPARTHAESVSATPDAPCETITVRPYHFNRDRPYDSLADLRAYALAIYKGRISNSTAGFSRGVPSTLLEIQVDSVIRKGDGYPHQRSFYVEWPAADFRLRGARFCNAAPAEGFAPAIGDEVVLYSYDAPTDEARKFLNLAPEQILLLKGGKALRIGKPGPGANRLERLDAAEALNKREQ